MENDINFEIYLFISPNKIAICVYQKSDFKELFKKEIIVDNFSDDFEFKILGNFLDENIKKIEKLLKQFVENINLIIDHKDFSKVQISIKKNNYGNLIDPETVTYLVNQAWDQCKKTFEDDKLIHILIDNYVIDKNNFNSLPKNLKCNIFSLDLSFISLSKKLIINLEQILKKNQISLNQVVSAKYIKEFFINNDKDIFEMGKNIIEGCNNNEVLLVTRVKKNQGFFEKFFNFFK